MTTRQIPSRVLIAGAGLFAAALTTQQGPRLTGQAAVTDDFSSIFVTDDGYNSLWHVTYVGATNASPMIASAQ